MNGPLPAYDPIRLNTQPEGCYCWDCQRYEQKECPYPGSNATMSLCNSFYMDVKKHDAAAAKKERERVLDEFMGAIEFRFDDTNRGRGVVGTIRGIRESLRNGEKP